jgi:hypothetical protein
MWITTITVTISALASYRHEGAATSAMALRYKNWGVPHIAIAEKHRHMLEYAQ